MWRICSPGFNKAFVYLTFFGLVLSTRDVLASGESNSTEVVPEDDTLDEDDDSLSEITFDEFKERYRRLIPYMTFYVASNYVNAQSQLQQNNYQDSPNSAALRKPQLSSSRPNTAPRRGTNNYRVNIPSQDKKFIPSIQFDPRHIGGDNDYFTPVRYNTKVNYDDYTGPIQAYQGQQAVYPEITTTSSQIAQKENRYFANVRPLRPYAANTRDHFTRKQPGNKPAQANGQEDYILDYISRPTGNTQTNYPSKEFEGLRYIPSAPSPSHSNVQPMKILESIPQRQPPTIPQVLRNSNANLNHIFESFQLSERLPEMLNKDNLDTSIQTLVEILNLLHNKKNGFPLMQAPQLPPLVQQQAPVPRYPQKVLNYHNYKSRTPTRPKVITETRFQATPSPLLITDDPERYMGMYAEDAKPKETLQQTYNINSLGNDKVVEYYTSYIQDIPKENKEVYNPTVKPESGGSSTEHSYEITEDLSDDILQDDRFTLPISTESNNYEEANETPTLKRPNVPKTSIKYGATRGKPDVDYPAYATIPETDFSCKEQRYKGFFGDPATGCQVWHYCDLNGGKSSFLCPNGTIFSQVALTCDWWFNVKCETTKQLYVLNERLYKYILPIMPKFPEDFTGPEVDRYLEIKFKEMEAKLKEKKLKKQQEEKEKLKNKQQTVKEDQ